LICVVKEKYYTEVFDEVGEPSSIWKRLKHLGLIKAKFTDKVLPFGYAQ